MARIKFLDGQYATRTSLVDDQLLQAGDGRYMIGEGTIANGSRRGTPYYLKQVDPSEWADPDVQEWTAAVDDDPAEDN